MGILDVPGYSRSEAVRTFRLPPGALHFFGHSFIANGENPANALGAVTYFERNISRTVDLLSGGSVKLGVSIGHGGYQTVQMISGGGKAGSPATLPTLLAALNPGDYVLLDIDDNDNGSTDAVTGDAYAAITLAQSITNETAIYTAIMAKGARPILTGKVPGHTITGSSAQYMQKRATWRRRYAEANGLPWLSWGQQFEDTTGDWLGYSGLAGGGTWNFDNIHQNGAATVEFARQILDALDLDGYPFRSPFLPVASVNTGALNDLASTNACFVTDTNTDGLADKVTVTGAPTATLVPMTTAEGVAAGQTMNWQQLVFTAAGTAQLGSLMALPAGHRYRIAMAIKTSGLSTSGFDIGLISNADAQLELTNGPRVWKQNIAQLSGRPVPAWVTEFVVPTLTDQRGFVRINMRGAGTISVGRFMFRDLTAEGIA